MNQSNMKNMVVLKNFPSNLVEEAIVIFKNNKRIRNLQKVDMSGNPQNKTTRNKDSDYILKEAEMLLTNYITEIEKNKNNKVISAEKNSKKYIRLKKYAYISSVIIFIETLIIFF